MAKIASLVSIQAMYGLSHYIIYLYKECTMLHENTDLINELKQSDANFAKMCDEHNQLNMEIGKLSNDVVKHASRDEEIEIKKRRKLQLKDEIYRTVENHSKS